MLDSVKSKYILKIITQNLKTKLKLRIFKYNKKVANRINIDNQDYKNFYLLNELNEQIYKKIKDIDITELHLTFEDFDNEKLEYLYKIEFKYLKELNLSHNKISDMTLLEKFNYKNLEKLKLFSNEIKVIDSLEKVHFKLLKDLDLR